MLKNCKYCQSEIDINAKVCPVCKRSLKGRLSKTIFEVFLGIVIVSIPIMYFIGRARSNNGYGSYGSSSGSSSYSSSCYITMSEFNKIKTGMSYSEVKDIVGCSGTVVSETEVMGSKMTIYSWYGSDGVSNANVNINDGKVINKTQIGL